MIGAVLGTVTAALVSRDGEAMPADNSETNKLVIQNLIERVWRNGSIDELPTFWTVDCINHADSAPQNLGLDALRRYHEGFAQWFLDFVNVEIDVQQQISENDRVVTQMLLRAVHVATRRNISLATIRIDRIFANKIAEHWSVADLAGLMKQLA
jgi:predicted ester cyclase